MTLGHLWDVKKGIKYTMLIGNLSCLLLPKMLADYLFRVIGAPTLPHMQIISAMEHFQWRETRKRTQIRAIQSLQTHYVPGISRD